MSIDEVVSHMRTEEFKPNCALGASSFSRPKLSLLPLIRVPSSPARFFGAPWLFDARK
jgi:hypothetical protein